MVCSFLSFLSLGMLKNDVNRIDTTIHHPVDTQYFQSSLYHCCRTSVWEGLPPTYYQYFYTTFTGYIYLNQSGAWRIKTIVCFPPIFSME